MDFNGDSNGFLWILMGILWVFMDFNGDSSGFFMDFHGDSMGFMPSSTHKSWDIPMGISIWDHWDDVNHQLVILD